MRKPVVIAGVVLLLVLGVTGFLLVRGDRGPGLAGLYARMRDAGPVSATFDVTLAGEATESIGSWSGTGVFAFADQPRFDASYDKVLARGGPMPLRERRVGPDSWFSSAQLKPADGRPWINAATTRIDWGTAKQNPQQRLIDPALWIGLLGEVSDEEAAAAVGEEPNVYTLSRPGPADANLERAVTIIVTLADDGLLSKVETTGEAVALITIDGYRTPLAAEPPPAGQVSTSKAVG